MVFGGIKSLCDLETHGFLVALLCCLSLDCRIVGSLVDSMTVIAYDSTLQTNRDSPSLWPPGSHHTPCHLFSEEPVVCKPLTAWRYSAWSITSLVAVEDRYLTCMFLRVFLVGST